MGKANIRHHVSEDVALRVRDKKAGRSVRIVLRPDTIARAVDAMRSQNDEAGAAIIRQVPIEELAETTIEQ
jgi:hypothetical protein